MQGIVINDTAGNKVFIAHSCEFCTMDTAGNHAHDCPNNPNKYMVGCNVAGSNTIIYKKQYNKDAQ